MYFKLAIYDMSYPFRSRLCSTHQSYMSMEQTRSILFYKRAGYQMWMARVLIDEERRASLLARVTQVNHKQNVQYVSDAVCACACMCIVCTRACVYVRV